MTGSRPPPTHWATDDAATVVSRVDQRRLGYVTELLGEAGAAPDTAGERAALYYRVLIGDSPGAATGRPLPVSASAALDDRRVA